MKKVFFACLFIACSFSSYAQLTLGAKGGSVLSDWTASNDSADIDVISKYGGNFALVLEYQIIDRISFRVEPGWSSRGATVRQEASFNVDGNIYTGIYREEYDINYFDIPLMAQLNLGEGPLRLRFLFGYNFSYATSGEVRERFILDPPVPGIGFDIKEEINFNDRQWNTTDNALIFGGGLNFFFGRHVALRLDARYFVGQDDLFLNDAQEAKNRSWYLNIGLEYRFEFY